MAVLSKITDTSNINWDNSVIDILQAPKSGGGTISGGVLTLQANESATFNLSGSLSGKEVNYLKMKITSRCNNANTDYQYKNIIKVAGSGVNNNTQSNINQYLFFKFDNEDYYDDELVFSIDNTKLTSFSLTITNKMSSTMTVTNWKLQRNYVEVNSDNFDEYANDYMNNNFDNYADDYMEHLTTLIIPLVQTLPDINDVPDGYICRLATQSNNNS